jgi:hypothetical protein
MAFRRGGLGRGRGWFRGGQTAQPVTPIASDDTDVRIDDLASRMERIESMLETLTKSSQ